MRLLVVILVSVVALAPACSTRSAQTGRYPDAPADPDDRNVKAMAEFSRRVEDYVKVHRAAAASVPPLRSGTGAEEIATRQAALAEAIRARRPSAQRGDIFAPSVAPMIVGIAQAYLTSPEGAVARASLARENPGTETPATAVPLVVNGPYEADVSLSTVPSPLLMRLPTLPREVEFRFVGKDLVLRDTSANIIADYLVDVAP